MTGPAVTVAFTTDLLVATRIRETAENLSVRIQVGSRSDDVLAALEGSEVTLLLVDLTAGGAAELIAEARARRPSAAEPHLTIVAFGSHVEREALAAAEAAGADQVLPRSAFAKRLPALLSSVQ